MRIPFLLSSIKDFQQHVPNGQDVMVNISTFCQLAHVVNRCVAVNLLVNEQICSWSCAFTLSENYYTIHGINDICRFMDCLKVNHMQMAM